MVKLCISVDSNGILAQYYEYLYSAVCVIPFSVGVALLEFSLMPFRFLGKSLAFSHDLVTFVAYYN